MKGISNKIVGKNDQNCEDVFASWIKTMAEADNRLYYRDQTPGSLNYLAEQALCLKPTQIVELGTLSGMSLRTWIKAGTGAQITAIALSFKALEKSRQILPIDLSSVTLFEKDIRDVDFTSLWRQDDRVLLFVDAHDLPDADIMEYLIQNAFPILPPKSTVIVDDLWHSEEVLNDNNIDGFFHEVIKNGIDPLQCFHGFFASYWKGGSFFGFKEVLPLMEWVNNNHVELEFNKDIKSISFAAQVLSAPLSAPLIKGEAYHNPLSHVISEPQVNPEILKVCLQGADLYKANNIKSTIDCFKRALDMDHSIGGPRYALGVCLARMGRLEDAASLLSKEIELPSRHPLALILLGDIKTMLKKEVTAFKDNGSGRSYLQGVTFFTVPKPFIGHADIIQRNAIRSWLCLDPRPEIILFGDEKGVEETAGEFGLRHVPAVKRNEYGTPLINDIFEQAERLASREVLCYINTDIILPRNFMPAVENAGKAPHPFLMIGQRWDLDIRRPVDFSKSAWEGQLREKVAASGTPHPTCGIDYFVFRRNLWDGIPPFAIGRTIWDNWLVYHPLAKGKRVIDASQVIMAVHQDHDYMHVDGGREAAFKGIEAQHNRMLAGRFVSENRVGDIARANWRLTTSGLKKGSPFLSHDLSSFAVRDKTYKDIGQKPVSCTEEDAGQNINSINITIAIVTYNRSRWISAAIQSALNQTSPAHEVLVVDDGSADNTGDVVRSFKDKGVRYIRTEKNQGRPFARNIGIKEAEGEYILWLDDDDILMPKAVEQYTQILKQKPACNLIYGKLQYFDDKSGKDTRLFDPVDWSDKQKAFLQSLSCGCSIPNPGTLVKKSLYDRAGYYDGAFIRAQDYEFWTRAARFAVPAKVNDVVCRYRTHDQNISHGNFIDLTYESIIIRRLFERFQKEQLLSDIDVKKAGYFSEIYRGISEKLLKYHDYYNTRKYLNLIDPGLLTEEDKKTSLSCDLYMGNIKKAYASLSTFSSGHEMNAKSIASFEEFSRKYVRSIQEVKKGLSVNNVKQARQRLAQITEDHGVTFDTMTLWGRFMVIIDNPDEAFQFFKKALACNPENDEAFNVALSAAKDEKGKEEVAGIRDRLLYKEDISFQYSAVEDEKIPASKTTYHEKAQALLRKAMSVYYRGKVDPAVKMIIKGIKIFSANKDLSYALADILINERQYKGALEVLGRFPADADEHKRLELTGYCKEAIGLDDEARECADRLLALDNNSPAAFCLKSKLAIKKDFIKDAEGYLLQAIKADASFAPAYSCLGLLKKKAGLDNEALDLLEKGFILAPVNNQLLTDYHKAARLQKAYDRAERVFRDALEAYPNHRLIHFQVIDLLLQQKKFEAAMEEIEKAILEYGVDDGFITAALSVRKRLGPKEIKDLSRKKATLSLCMIVKDEEHNIGKCLINLRPLADEMIVVDTGSSDRTKALAEIFGAKVYDFEWNNDFSAARNHSLSKASGDWILVMDADEIISSKDHDAFRNIIKNNKQKTKAFSFVTRNYMASINTGDITRNDGSYKDLEMGYGWVPSEKTRLFRNTPHIRFEYPVHEIVEPSLIRNLLHINQCHIPIHHYGKLNNAKISQKGESYFRLGIEKLEKSSDNAKAIYELAIQAAEMKKWDEAIDLWKRHNELNPDNSLAHINMGTVYFNMERFDEATESAKRALELDPERKEASNNYALYQIYQGKAEIAIPILQGLSPDYLPGRFNLAVAYACEGRKEDALIILEELKKAIAVSALIKACHSVSKKLSSLGQSQYAVSVFEMTARLFVGYHGKPYKKECKNLGYGKEDYTLDKTCSNLEEEQPET